MTLLQIQSIVNDSIYHPSARMSGLVVGPMCERQAGLYNRYTYFVGHPNKAKQSKAPRLSRSALSVSAAAPKYIGDSRLDIGT